MTKVSHDELARLRSEFPITEKAIYLDHAAVGPTSKGVAAAVQRQATLHCEDVIGARSIYTTCYDSARRASACLVGSVPERLAFIQNTSHGLSLIANGQPWKAGDNVVVPALDFPSNFLPWLRLERMGVEVRRLHVPDGRVTAAALAPIVDQGTRVIALSAVQYYNGYRVDLAPITTLAHEHDALLVVDGTQAVGAVQIDMRDVGLDALVVSAHKWMLGPLGIGFMALSDRLLQRTEVTQLGWLSVNDPFAFNREIDLPSDASRFEPGTENAAGLFGLQARLAEIEAFGADRIEARVLGLQAGLAETVARAGFEVVSPMESGGRSAILAFRRDGVSADKAAASLRRQNICLSARHGNLRVSPHYYNSEEELDEMVERLGQLIR